MYRILIVEDDFDISELLQSWLTEAGYQTAEAEDGLKALEVFESGQFDLVLLDLMLPRLDGFGVCEWIRKRSDVPIVMLTALDGEDEQLRGYDLRIDDYVTKPFSMPVLLRKIGAILRRCRGEDRPGANLLRYRDLTLDLDAYTAMRGDLMLELTNREFECLRELLQNQGRVMTYQMLVSRIWNYDYLGDDRVIYSHIKNLRRKLGADYIRTVRGVGYRVDKDYAQPDASHLSDDLRLDDRRLRCHIWRDCVSDAAHLYEHFAGGPRPKDRSAPDRAVRAGAVCVRRAAFRLLQGDGRSAPSVRRIWANSVRYDFV